MLKAYKLYNPTTKKTIVSRDLIFDEEASWEDSLDQKKEISKQIEDLQYQSQ